MITYISLLRGINVSGHKPVRMAALKKSYESMGFQEITTYVQSGNVVFRAGATDKLELGLQISRQIETDFGFTVAVIVLDGAELEQLAGNNRSAKQQDKDPRFLHITFLASIPQSYDHAVIEARKQPGEEIFIAGQAIYLYCPEGYGNSKLTNSYFESKLKTGATTRNWKTTCELLKLASKFE